MSKTDADWMEDLNPKQQKLLELLGEENFIKLMDVFGGTDVYIPKSDKVRRLERNEQIRAEFNGYNFGELARRYGLSEVWIRNIVSGQVRAVRARPMDGQISLFVNEKT